MISFDLPRRSRSRINHGRSFLIEDRVAHFAFKLDVLRTAASIALSLVVRLMFSVEEDVTEVSNPVAEGTWLAQLLSVAEEIEGILVRAGQEGDLTKTRMRADEDVIEA